jgi:hypothetical protein
MNFVPVSLVKCSNSIQRRDLQGYLLSLTEPQLPHCLEPTLHGFQSFPIFHFRDFSEVPNSSANQIDPLLRFSSEYLRLGAVVVGTLGATANNVVLYEALHSLIALVWYYWCFVGSGEQQSSTSCAVHNV